jgi:hypothetical protein
MTERKATVAPQLETGASPDSSASDYQLQEDGGVAYTGDPTKFSEDMAAAVANGPGARLDAGSDRRPRRDHRGEGEYEQPRLTRRTAGEGAQVN